MAACYGSRLQNESGECSIALHSPHGDTDVVTVG